MTSTWIPFSNARPSRRAVLAGGAAAGLIPGLAHAAGADPIICSISLEDNRVWIAASIGTSKPLLFIVDTGASYNMIKPQIAEELKLPIVSTRRSVGLGRDVAMGDYVRARELVLGGALRIPNVGFTTNELDGFNPDMAGILAAGLFTAYDTDIDFDHSQLRIWPGGRPNRDGLTALTSQISTIRNMGSSRKVVANVGLDGHTYRLLCDTGAPHGVLLYPSTSARAGLFTGDRPYAPEMTAGIGGRASKLSRVIRMQMLQVGPVAIQNPLVWAMNPGAAEHGAEDDHDGLLGLDMLQLFLLSTDVKAGKLWVSRNSRPLPRHNYRLSGMWVDKVKNGDIVVSDVGTGSPAAKAGLRTGDVIVEPRGLEDVLRAVNGPKGKDVAIKVRSGGQVRDVTYALNSWF